MTCPSRSRLWRRRVERAHRVGRVGAAGRTARVRTTADSVPTRARGHRWRADLGRRDHRGKAVHDGLGCDRLEPQVERPDALPAAAEERRVHHRAPGCRAAGPRHPGERHRQAACRRAEARREGADRVHPHPTGSERPTTGVRPQEGFDPHLLRVDTFPRGIWHGRLTIPHRVYGDGRTYAYAGTFAARWCEFSR